MISNIILSNKFNKNVGDIFLEWIAHIRTFDDKPIDQISILPILIHYSSDFITLYYITLINYPYCTQSKLQYFNLFLQWVDLVLVQFVHFLFALFFVRILFLVWVLDIELYRYNYISKAMSFIIKKFLRRLIQQYLNIHDQINLDKGQLQLPSGHLNQNNINKILKQKNIAATVLYSQYTGLSLNLPIIEILSKPIVLKMQNLRIVVLIDSNMSNQNKTQSQNKHQKAEQPPTTSPKQNKVSSTKEKSQIQTSQQPYEQQQKQQDQTTAKNEKSYLKSIISRLLTNMQIQIKNLEIIVRFGHQNVSQAVFESIDDHQYKICLENLVAKNSLSLLQANILKKIVCMSRFRITLNKFVQYDTYTNKQIMEDNLQNTHSSTIVEISDLNMSLNIDYTRVTMICLLDKLIVGVQTKLVKWIAQKMKVLLKKKNKKNSNKRISSQKNIESPIKKQTNIQPQSVPSIEPDLQAIQIKINQIKLSIVDSNQVAINNTKNPEICSITILKLEASKQKLKSVSSISTSNTVHHSSEISLFLQSVAFSCISREEDVMENIMVMRMCERKDKVQNSTIQGWNKKKRKQFQVRLELKGQEVGKVEVNDLEISVSVTKNLVNQSGRLVQFCQKIAFQFFNNQEKISPSMTRIQKKNEEEEEEEDEKTMKTMQIQKPIEHNKKKSASSIPEINLTNIKFQLKLLPLKKQNELNHRINVWAHISQSVSLKSIVKNIPNGNQVELLISLPELAVNVNDKCEVLSIKDGKIRYCKQVDKDGKINQEITVSVHAVNSNIDTSIVQRLVSIIKSSQFILFIESSKQLSRKTQNLQKIITQNITIENKEKVRQNNKHKLQNVQMNLEKQLQQEEIQPMRSKINIKQEHEHDQNHKLELSQKNHISKTQTSPKIYIRLNSVAISIGSRPKSQNMSVKQDKHVFNPIFIVQIGFIKIIKIEEKMNIKVTIKSISAISPHNLSHAVLLRAPVKIKFCQTERQTKGKINEKNAGICGISILDPLFIDVQQQHILLLSTLVKSIQTPNFTYFTSIKNSTKNKIKFKLNQLGSEKQITENIQRQKLRERDREREKDFTDDSRLRKNMEQSYSYNFENLLLNRQYEVLPFCRQEVYLFQLKLRIEINGEISQMIDIGLGELLTSRDLQQGEQNIDQQQISPKSRLQKSTSLTLDMPQPDHSLKPHFSTQKSLSPPPPPLSSSSFISSTNKNKSIHKILHFPYHDECKYILEINYDNGHLDLNVRYKYQLHLFQGIKGCCGVDKVQIRVIKFDCYEKIKIGENGDHGDSMIVDWELLEQDKIEHTSILIQNKHLQQYKLCPLMTNSIKYKIFGLYPQQIHTQHEKDSSKTHKPCDYYILQYSSTQSLSHSQLQTNSHHYYLMPFLVFINNLSHHQIKLKITSKKSSIQEQYSLPCGSVYTPVNSSFDYYMKQFMIELILFDTHNQLKDTNKTQNINVKYQSQLHYFNTFFMVNESFENVIQLRSTNSTSKRYVRIRESFVHKTKILEIQDCMSVENKTDYPLELVIIPANIGRIVGTSNTVSDNNGIYKLNPHTCSLYPNKTKKDDILRVSYLFNNKRQNTIQIPISKLIQNNNKLLLSYNFCRVADHSVLKCKQQGKQRKLKENLQNDKKLQQNQQYFQILIKLEIKAVSHSADHLTYNSSNLQVQLVFTHFLVFYNFCSQARFIKLNGSLLKSAYHELSTSGTNFCLPSNTNKDFNNKWLPINSQQIYEDLFVNNRNWIMQGSSNQMRIQLLPLQREGQKNIEDAPILYLTELITHKIIQINRAVYSLVKSLKDDKIELYFGDHLFANNAPLKYFVFNNRSDQYFLMNYSETEYAKCLLFPDQFDTSSEDKKKIKKDKRTDNKETDSIQVSNSFKKQQNRVQEVQIVGEENKKNEKVEQNMQSLDKSPQKYFQYKKQGEIFNSFSGSKVFIEGSSKNPISIMLNKDKHDIFLCDSEYRKLQPLTLRKLQKLRIKHQKYQIQNFTILDLQNQNISQPQSQSPQIQFLTSSLSFKLSSRRKNYAFVTDIKSISIRSFENDKVDFLVQDVSVCVALQNDKEEGQSPNARNKMQNYQILRISEETYLLLQGKVLQNKLAIVKNVYLRCKIVDLHINKELLKVATHFSKIFKFVSQYLQPQLQQLPKSHHKLSTPQSDNPQTKKILNLSKQKILMIRSVCIHPINLCLTVQTNPSLDFSNMITLPQFTISNKVYRMTSWIKQISNHYLTNVIGKFPKLSFIYQNLRSPLAMLKSIMEARSILASGDKEDQRYRIALMTAYVELERAFFTSANSKSFEKRLLTLIGPNNKKSDLQLQKVNHFLLELSLGHGKKNSQQVFICPLKNVVSSNITRLSQMVSIQICYYLTNKNIRVICQSLPSQQISIKQIQSAKVTKYNKKNAQFTLTFKRRGVHLKIVDQFQVCHNIINHFNSILL